MGYSKQKPIYYRIQKGSKKILNESSIMKLATQPS